MITAVKILFLRPKRTAHGFVKTAGAVNGEMTAISGFLTMM